MIKSLFTGDKLAEAIEKIFILDRFVLWEGKENPSLIRFLNHWDISDDKTLKIHKDDGYYLVPVGSWIVRAPDGSIHAFGKGVRFVSNELDWAVKTLQKEIDEFEIPVTLHEEEKPITTFIPEDPYETEVVEEGNAISLRRKLDKDGNPILKKRYSVAVDPAHGKDWTSYRVYDSESDKPSWMKRFVKEVDKWKK